jgi:serine/threonine-protein kinase
MRKPNPPEDGLTPPVSPPANPSETRTVSHVAEPSQEQEGPAVALPLEPGRPLAGRYTVLEQLGQGGMGVVLAAYDARLDRRVALKLLLPRREARGDEAARARLLREAQAMARLSHPNVVAVYDAGSLEDGHIFIAMEMVEGQTLRQWTKERARSWREVLEAFLAAGRGLAAAHAAGLVHRDFKPENVLVGRDGRVRVTDFGTALTLPGAVPGTPRYLAPELLTGAPADARSDVFAFCVSLHEALFHQYPFPGDTVRERLRAMAQGQLAPLPTRTEVPAWVGRVLREGLSADPRERPPSMEALLLALSRSPAGSRARWLALAASLVVGLGLATSAGVAWRLHATERAGRHLRTGGDQQAHLRFLLARALAGTGSTAEQVREQVSQVRALLARSEVPDARLRATVERWARPNASVIS